MRPENQPVSQRSRAAMHGTRRTVLFQRIAFTDSHPHYPTIGFLMDGSITPNQASQATDRLRRRRCHRCVVLPPKYCHLSALIRYSTTSPMIRWQTGIEI